MAKRSSNEWDSKRVKGIEDGVPIDIEEPIEYQDIPHTVRLVLLRNIRLTFTGAVTGNKYIFDGAGSTLDVDALDAPDMLSKDGGRTCCSENRNRYFDLAS